MRKKFLFLAAALFFMTCKGLFAGYYGKGDLRFVTELTMLGVNQAVGYNGTPLLEDRDTIFWLFGGARTSNRGYYRDADDDNYDEPEDSYRDFQYWATNITWGAGISQGLIDDPRKYTDLLYISVFYKGVREWYKENEDKYFFQSDLSDRHGLLQNSVVLEIAFNDVLVDKETGMKRGIFSNATFEYAPKFFFNDCLGKSDFRKYYATLKVFVPIYEFSGETPFSAFYFGNSTSFDYVTGDDISLHARQCFGSISCFSGLGGLVRGYESNRFDSELKIANRSEFRFLLKKIPINTIFDGKTFIRFSAIAFFDMGYYGMLSGSDNGFICSCGIGGLASFMDVLSISGYLAAPLAQERLDRRRLVPVLAFGFKF